MHYTLPTCSNLDHRGIPVGCHHHPSHRCLRLPCCCLLGDESTPWSVLDSFCHDKRKRKDWLPHQYNINVLHHYNAMITCNRFAHKGREGGSYLWEVVSYLQEVVSYLREGDSCLWEGSWLNEVLSLIYVKRIGGQLRHNECTWLGHISRERLSYSSFKTEGRTQSASTSVVLQALSGYNTNTYVSSSFSSPLPSPCVIVASELALCAALRWDRFYTEGQKIYTMCYLETLQYNHLHNSALNPVL